jgi:hypothetical protein
MIRNHYVRATMPNNAQRAMVARNADGARLTTHESKQTNLVEAQRASAQMHEKCF